MRVIRVIPFVLPALGTLLLVASPRPTKLGPTLRPSLQTTRPVPRELDFPFYSLRDGFRSLLQLVSDLPEPFSLRITVHSLSGQTAVTPPMTIRPQEKLLIDMQTLLAKLGLDGDSDFQEGSISVTYTLDKTPLLGQVTISNPTLGLVYESLAAENDPGQTGIPPVLEGVWWGLTPGREAEAKVMAGNTSKAAVIADVYLTFGGQRRTSAPVVFGPYETKVLSIRELLAKLGVKPEHVSEGGITIIGRGTPPALIATGMIANRETGFSTTMHFMLMGAPMSSTLYAPGVPIGLPSADSPFTLAGTFTPHVIVRNLLSTEQTATVTVEYPSGSGSQEVTLAPLTLGPFATKDLALDAAALEQLPLPLPYCSIRVQYSGQPGSAIVEVASVEQNQNLVVDSKMRDPADPMTGSGINPWHIDDETEAVLFLTNAGGAPARIGFQIQAGGVHYYLTNLKLNPRETRAIDIRKLRDDQQPDFQGNKIPPNATDGSLVWIRIDKLPVVGRVLVLDSRRGISSNFNCSCTFHCDTGYQALSVSPASTTLLVNGTQQFTATETYGDCYGTLHYYNVTFGAFWSSSNPSVCSVNSVGVATAVAVGSASITATFSDDKPRWFVADQICNDNYITKSASASVAVKPRIDSVSPTRGAITTTVSVTISGGGFGTSPTVSAGTGITVTINSATNTQIQASFAISTTAPAGDHAVTAMASGQTSNSVNFFVQVPTSLSIVPGTDSTTAETACTTSGGLAGCGGTRTFRYQVNDQVGQAIQASMEFWDTIATTSPNNLNLQSYNTTCPGNTGPCGVFTFPDGTLSETLTVCAPACKSGNLCITAGSTGADQVWHIAGNALTSDVKHLSYQCNRILVNSQ